MSEDIEVRRRRAAWRAAHRGTKELDLLVGRFAEARLPGMAAADLERFERFLAVTDPEIQAWLLGPPSGGAEGEFADVVAEIRQFHGLA
ncbi:succinate dehydrogenase assembly factor 2 [Hyphomicrobium sp.]|jgi:antitoxin CptB|uniref:succinate dehydrogenase assembly factor 2 n=1 Tax=Hyphomicrobium sp. TaxID=82 RepID=UPI002FE34642